MLLLGLTVPFRSTLVPHGNIFYWKWFIVIFWKPINNIKAHDLPTDLNKKPTAIFGAGDLKISAVAGHHRDAPLIIYRIDYAGESITFNGDIEAKGLADLRDIAHGTDLLIFTC